MSRGLVASVMACFAPGVWLRCRQVVDAVPPEFKDDAPTILSQKCAAGVLIRRGEPRAYEYQLAADVTAPRSPDAAPAVDAAADLSKPLSPSIGTACGPFLPPNRAHGRIDEALRAVLYRKVPKTLDQILAALPIGWSRSEAIGALTDAVLGGWVRGDDINGVPSYVLTEPEAIEHQTPPPPLLPYGIKDRAANASSGLRALLADACADTTVGADVIQHLADANVAIERAWFGLS